MVTIYYNPTSTLCYHNGWHTHLVDSAILFPFDVPQLHDIQQQGADEKLLEVLTTLVHEPCPQCYFAKHNIPAKVMQNGHKILWGLC